MTTFALVHGAWHGAWCWELLTPLLRQEGHDVVAMDLPCDDPSAGYDTYADVVCAALGECDNDVILVGHSMSASTIALVADRRPVRHMVYLCALVPDIGWTLGDQLRHDDMMCPGWDAALSEPDEQLRTTWVDLESTRALLYADCDESTQDAAVARLRPQAYYALGSPLPLAELPAVSCTSVICSDDRMLNPDWSKRVARDRLGAELIELPESHSPFLSRPSALADVLIHLAEPNT